MIIKQFKNIPAIIKEIRLFSGKGIFEFYKNDNKIFETSIAEGAYYVYRPFLGSLTLEEEDEFFVKYEEQNPIPEIYILFDSSVKL